MGIPVLADGWWCGGKRYRCGWVGFCSGTGTVPARLSPSPPRLVDPGDRATGTQCHARQGIGHREGGDFLFGILFWRLDTKRFNICLK